MNERQLHTSEGSSDSTSDSARMKSFELST